MRNCVVVQKLHAMLIYQYPSFQNNGQKKPVDLTRQTIFGFIPYLNLYALYLIQKLRKFFLIGILVSVILIIIETMAFVVLGSTVYKFEPEALVETIRLTPLTVAHVIGGILFSGFLVRRWSKKWNEQFVKPTNSE